MRIFWGLILVLVLGSAGYMYSKLTRPDQAPARTPMSETVPAEQSAAATPVSAPDPAADPSTEPDRPSAAEPIVADNAQNPPPDPALDAASLDTMLGTMTGAVQGDQSAPSAPAPKEESARPTETPAVTPDAQSENGASPAPAAEAAPAVAPESEPIAAETLPATPMPKAATFAGYEVIPATRTVREDGSLLLDDHYIVSGKGTEAEPYKITWDLLTSSSQTLAPRQGKKSLPERITMLDGTWVELSGYIAFPLMVQEADELLLMLNQWDGCCIGVPPTPYDAIEVSLIKKVKGQDRFAVQGTLKGKLGVKPHLVGEWLVGIYVMDSAALSTKAIGGVSQ